MCTNLIISLAVSFSMVSMLCIVIYFYALQYKDWKQALQLSAARSDALTKKTQELIDGRR